MKKFTQRTIVLFLLILMPLSALLLFGYGVVGSQYKYSYVASLIDKVSRLKSINEPKIILVGNSNVSFGFDSEMIEKEFKMPVVNLGLHGGLGNVFHEEIAKLNIGEGDIVVVCHSKFHDDDKIENLNLAWTTYDYNNELLPIFRIKDYFDLLPAFPTYYKKGFLLWLSGEGNRIPEGTYCRTSFNEYGDLAYRPKEQQFNGDEYFSNNRIEVPKINSICINRLNELNQYCIQNGASLVVAGYPIAYGKYTEFTEEDFVEFQMNLTDSLDCKVISDYTDYFYPYDYFYNTELHLNEIGAVKRTLQLINDLNAWLNEN